MTTELTKLHDLFGTQLLLMFGSVAVLYAVWSTVPVWWPALQAIRWRRTLIRPWSFVITTAALAYGGTALAALCGGGALAVARLLDEAPHPWLLATVAPGTWLTAWITPWFGYLLLGLHLAITACITHQLARHWDTLCTRVAPPRREVRQ